MCVWREGDVLANESAQVDAGAGKEILRGKTTERCRDQGHTSQVPAHVARNVLRVLRTHFITACEGFTHRSHVLFLTQEASPFEGVTDFLKTHFLP